ncbi:MAG: CehA/McbA family metallohydrolase [Acidobacteria bacterium]|nr:CehA/McbA family metallohydrolase [Acidobacteriota bacterium]
MKRQWAVVSALLTFALCPLPCALVSAQATKWYRGNTHTHTLNSDGENTPDEVVRWYRSNGYQFLVITDHEYLTDAAALNAIFARDEQFLMIPGQEVTGRAQGKPVHVNQIGAKKLVMPAALPTVFEVLQRDVNMVHEAGAIAQINHPNFGWALTADDLVRVENAQLLEIWNGHPQVNNLGGGGATPSAESMWDTALTAGKRLFAIADDDAHHFKPEHLADPASAAPNRGWIYVRAPKLTEGDILDAIRRGDFYASNGVELTDVAATSSSLTVSIKPTTYSRYRTQFIGAGGTVLAESTTNPAVYQFKGDEKYVRARVIESNAKMAWTQPIFLTR